MKFGLVIFFLVFALLTSCASVNTLSFDTQESGAWGPIIIKADKISNAYSIIQVDHPETKIEVKVIQTDNQLSLYPSVPLMIGKSYQLLEEGNPEPVIKKISVREPCLAYLGDPYGSSEVWKKCPGQEPIQLTKTDGKVEDFIVSRIGEVIFYKINNEFDQVEIWQVNPDGSKTKRIYECSGSECSDLDFCPLTGKLVFLQTINKPQIKMLDLVSETIEEIEGSASELKLSPDGQYLSYLDNLSGQLTIVNLANSKRITVQSDSGLVGEWAGDSHAILFGEFEYWGGIPGVKVYELNVISGEITPILNDPSQELEFYQPMYSREEDVYLTSVRLRSAGPSKQLWLLREGAQGVKQITNDPLYFYSSPSWNSDYSELVFQRYPINISEGHPQVVVWNQKFDTFQVIAENSSKPFWLP